MTFVDKIRRNFHPVKILSYFIIGIAVIMILFPREGKFRFEFQKGKYWSHEVLVAPFNFPIYKTETLLQSEKDSVLQRFIPYFRLDSTVYATVLNRFNENFGTEFQTYLSAHEAFSSFNNQVGNSYLNRAISMMRDSYFQGIESLLSQFYERGIVDDPLQFENTKLKSEVIKVIKGNLVEERLLTIVYTQKSAYEYLSIELEKLGALIEPSRRSGDRFIQSFDILPYIEPNLLYDNETSARMQQDLIDQVSITQGMVQAGEKIIALGELINDEKFQILQSLKREYETNPSISRNYSLIVLGQTMLVVLSFIVLYLFLYNFRKEVLAGSSKTFFIIFIIIIVAALAALTINNERISLYVVPIVIVPIILKTFYDSRIAIFVHILTILIIGFWAPNAFEFFLMNFLAGVVSVFAMQNMYRRGALFISAVFTFLVYAMVYTALGLMEEGRFGNLDLRNYAWFGGNALLVLTCYPLIFIFEKIFGFLSDATLIELGDTNQPLLRKLSESAPGTFQHSLQVGNLAEEGVLRIKGNPLLVRTAALYHDIGKLEDPIYFIENQTNHFNPHEKLKFEESARKIINHVTYGVELARKAKLPELIIDFIRTHHGTTTVQYFYRSFLNQYPGIEIDTMNFTYPGPKPYSKETAVLMMADAIEAASRSLKSVNPDSINELVERIIQQQFDQDQFIDVDLTFRDVEVLKQVFKEKLANIYHTRIEYPS